MTSVLSNIDELVSGPVVRPQDEGYDELRQVFNGMIDRRPAMIIRCRSAADVAVGIAYARDCGLPLSVRAGGHGVTGDAVIDGAVCLDLRPMNAITLDERRGVATVEAGANWGEFDAAAQRIGMAVTGGRIRGTGVAGLTLGSGSGWLERKYGLTCDSLLSVELVTAEGQQLTVSGTEHPELFWGIRGGGGNFGVVTRFEFQLHPVGPQVYGGLVLYPPFAPADLVRHFRDFMAEAPDDLGAGMAFICAPDEPFVPEFARGRPVIATVLSWFGPPEQAEDALRPMREYGPPVRDMVGPIAYVDLQNLLEPGTPHGLQNYWKAEFLGDLPDSAIDELVGFTQAVPSRHTQTILMPLGGAITRVDDDAMAFGQRSAPFNLHILSMWEDAADSERQIAWTRDFHAAIKPYSTGGAYLNFVGNEGNDRVQAAFGPDKYARLVALKRRWDPDNVFRHNQNIPPDGPAPGGAGTGGLSTGGPASATAAAATPRRGGPPPGAGAPPPFAMLELLNGMWVARAVQVAANLGLADRLTAGPRPVAELAAETGCEPASLRRLLHALSTVGVFRHAEGDAFGQTELSAALAPTTSLSVGGAARLFGSDWQWRSWQHLEHAVRTGRPGFDAVHGVDLVHWLDEIEPHAGEQFDRAMAGLSDLLNQAVLNAYDFSGAGLVADVSGGHSPLLLQLLGRHPELSGLLLDRPVAARRYQAALTGTDLGARVEVIACDYRTALPRTADTILLNRVLHDWDDEQAARILDACRAALRPGGRLVVIEQLLGDDKRAAFLDLQMLVLRGGRERRQEELAALFDRSGLRLARTVRTASPMCLLVGEPAQEGPDQ